LNTVNFMGIPVEKGLQIKKHKCNPTRKAEWKGDARGEGGGILVLAVGPVAVDVA
jgi:hypothetical protein